MEDNQISGLQPYRRRLREYDWSCHMYLILSPGNQVFSVKNILNSRRLCLDFILRFGPKKIMSETENYISSESSFKKLEQEKQRVEGNENLLNNKILNTEF